MTETLIHSAVLIGAIIQVGIGIGFSIVVGPLLVVALGAKTAVPVLLALNLLVSCVAMFGFRRDAEAPAIGPSVVGALAGIVIGTWTFVYLSESLVTIAMAVTLLGGTLATWIVPPQRLHWQAVAGAGTVSGIATAWTATPDPVMALGLMLAGYDGAVIRRLVQPIALISYGLRRDRTRP